jgi:hypothetical protein
MAMVRFLFRFNPMTVWGFLRKKKKKLKEINAIIVGLLPTNHICFSLKPKEKHIQFGWSTNQPYNSSFISLIGKTHLAFSWLVTNQPYE